MKQLNGWQRLWVVIVIVWACVVPMVGYTLWPVSGAVANTAVYGRMNPANVEHLFGEGLPIEDARPLEAEPAWPILKVDGHVLRFLGRVSESDKSRTARDYQTALRHVLALKRAVFAGEAFAWWAVPSASLYLVGWAVAW